MRRESAHEEGGSTKSGLGHAKRPEAAMQVLDAEV